MHETGTNGRRKPLVSVHCAAYNHERYVEECVRSVLGQTLEDIEMVVVDDGSTDGTWERLRTLANEDARLQILRHGVGERRGRVASERLAIARSSAPVLARIDSDDRWLPHKLERQLPALEAGALLTYGRVRYIDQRSQLLPSRGNGWQGVPPGDVAPGMSPFEALLISNYIPALTAVFRRDAYERVGGYLSIDSEDCALWARLIALDDPVFIDDFLGDYRVHPSQFTAELQSDGGDIRADLRVVETLRAWPDLPEHLIRVTESLWRCQKALVEFVDGQGTEPSEILLEEDAAVAALVIDRKLSRLSELRGRWRVYRWMNRVIGAGPDFRRHVGAQWSSYLTARIETAYKERDVRKVITFATARLVLRANLMRIAIGQAFRARKRTA